MGTISKALKVRIYPNKAQETLILKSIGCARFVFNKMLEERISVYKNLQDNKRELYDYKYKTETELKAEFPWLREVSKFVLESAKMDLSSAYQNFFRSIKNKTGNKNTGFPKFKKRGRRDSYREYITTNNIRFDFDLKKIKLPKLGWLNFRDKKGFFPGEVKQATVSRTRTGKYFVSVLFEQELILPGILLDKVKPSRVIGLDMSLEKFFVDSNGGSPAYERLYRNHEKKLKFLQKGVSRKIKGSNNRKKAQLRVNKVFETIANSRRDFTQKLSTDLVRNYDVIVVEQLSMKGMSQALRLGKSVMDLGYSQFVNQLKYKTLWNNKILVEADRWFASSKTCSFCGFKKADLLLQEREWVCPNCGRHHNRDHNAGLNLKNYGLKELGLERPEVKPVETTTSIQNFCGEQVGSGKQETLRKMI